MFLSFNLPVFVLGLFTIFGLDLQSYSPYSQKMRSIGTRYLRSSSST